eukprot:3901545-Prymnesium_polylepis.1
MLEPEAPVVELCAFPREAQAFADFKAEVETPPAGGAPNAHLAVPVEGETGVPGEKWQVGANDGYQFERVVSDAWLKRQKAAFVPTADCALISTNDILTS